MTLRIEVSLYVSCDALSCRAPGPRQWWLAMFRGATQEEVTTKFVEAGWLIVDAAVLCPDCVKAGRVAAQDAAALSDAGGAG